MFQGEINARGWGEDVEVLTEVALQEDGLARSQGLRLAARGKGFRDV